MPDDFGNGFFVPARKKHSCVWCYGHIVVGEVHYRYKGKFEGDWQDWRMHSECEEAHKRESEGGEICPETHPRGRTCGELEDDRIAFTKKLGERLERMYVAGTSWERLAYEALREVRGWQSLEECRLIALKRSATSKKKEGASA